MTHTSHVQKTSKTSPFSRLDISFPLMCMYKCVCIYIYICYHTYRADLSILTLLKIINILPFYSHVHVQIYKKGLSKDVGAHYVEHRPHVRV